MLRYAWQKGHRCIFVSWVLLLRGENLSMQKGAAKGMVKSQYMVGFKRWDGQQCVNLHVEK